MYFYQKLRSFNVVTIFMRMFCSCFTESVLTYFFICWFGSLTLKNRNSLEGIVRMCSIMADTNPNDLSHVYKVRATKKIQWILADPSHLLFSESRLLPSGRRYNLPRCRTNRWITLGNSKFFSFFVCMWIVVCWLMWWLYFTAGCATDCPLGIIIVNLDFELGRWSI